MSVFVVIFICFFKQNRYDLLWIWTRALHFENDAWWNILFSDKTKGFAFLIEYLCKRAYNNGGMGRGGGWIGLCYIEICIKIKSPQWGKNTILGCNHLLQHTRQEKLLNSLIMFDDWIISLVSHCRRLDLITRTWSLITFCFSFTIVKGAAWVLLSERWLQRSCFFFFFCSIQYMHDYFKTPHSFGLTELWKFFMMTIRSALSQHNVLRIANVTRFKINWFVLQSCLSTAVFDSDSSLFGNAAHHHKCAQRKG